MFGELEFATDISEKVTEMLNSDSLASISLNIIVLTTFRLEYAPSDINFESLTLITAPF